MLHASQIKQFHTDGYLLVPGALKEHQVKQLRSIAEGVFIPDYALPHDSEQVRVDVFCRFVGTHWLLVHPPLVAALRSLLGDDFVYMHEWACHSNGFGGWHKDTTSQEKAGKLFHYEPDYLQVQVAFYLQDNGPYGGGLDVIRGSHRDRLDTHLQRDFRTRARNKLRRHGLLQQPPGYLSIPSKAGDMVIFHFRMSHQATQPKRSRGDWRKLAFFLTASRANQHASAFVQWIESERSPHLGSHRIPVELIAYLREHGREVID